MNLRFSDNLLNHPNLKSFKTLNDTLPSYEIFNPNLTYSEMREMWQSLEKKTKVCVRGFSSSSLTFPKQENMQEQLSKLLSKSIFSKDELVNILRVMFETAEKTKTSTSFLVFKPKYKEESTTYQSEWIIGDYMFVKVSYARGYLFGLFPPSFKLQVIEIHDSAILN